MFAKGIVDHDIYVSFNNVRVIFRKLKLPYFNDRNLENNDVLTPISIKFGYG
jgi:hypothetical protein